VLLAIVVRCRDTEDDSYRELTRRRSRLPAAAPETDHTLWSLLFRNIGKDLSKISMPVSMNEPLNSLQVSF